MVIIEDRAGTSYVLLKRSTEASLVRNLETGSIQYLPTSAFARVTTDDRTADSKVALATNFQHRIPNAAAHELITMLYDTGPSSVRVLLNETTLCERDFFAVTRELVLGDVLEPTDIAGEQGYALTDEARSNITGTASAGRAQSPPSTDSSSGSSPR